MNADNWIKKKKISSRRKQRIKNYVLQVGLVPPESAEPQWSSENVAPQDYIFLQVSELIKPVSYFRHVTL